LPGIILVKEVECLIDVSQETLDPIALVRPGILSQPLDQFLFLGKQRRRRARLEALRERQYPCPDLDPRRWRAKAYRGLIPQVAKVPEALAMHCWRVANWQFPG
jgi:hypothetical protein